MTFQTNTNIKKQSVTADQVKEMMEKIHDMIRVGAKVSCVHDQVTITLPAALQDADFETIEKKQASEYVNEPGISHQEREARKARMFTTLYGSNPKTVSKLFAQGDGKDYAVVDGVRFEVGSRVYRKGSSDDRVGTITRLKTSGTPESCGCDFVYDDGENTSAFLMDLGVVHPYDTTDEILAEVDKTHALTDRLCSTPENGLGAPVATITIKIIASEDVLRVAHAINRGILYGHNCENQTLGDLLHVWVEEGIVDEIFPGERDRPTVTVEMPAGLK